ncbi:MAG: stage II sporulation protein M [Thermodesulfobacteriota bacterium]|nr:stage II sporulation protein M [Thermodesulfobacteriota bacterium]
MRQEHFETINAAFWTNYERTAGHLQTPSSRRQVQDAYNFPRLYRKICNQYAIALSRQYSPALVNRLHAMVLQGHKIIYHRSAFQPARFVHFFSHTFPDTFRKTIGCFWIALALFLTAFIGTGVSCYYQHDLIYSLMDESQVTDFEFMYDPANKNHGRTAETQNDTSIAMFGFYIKNNISIGFRTFAGGMLAGAGTVFFLIFNGIFLGAVSGHVTRLGFTQTFWPFVSGHGAFELTAIIISGGAGLVLALAIIAPGNLTRTDALKQAAVKALHLILGAAAMLLLAAFIEAFWSPVNVPVSIKYAVAAALWALVIVYLSMAGKKWT